MKGPDDSDARLLHAIACGNHNALMRAFDRYAGVLLGMCRLMTGAAAEADEVVHDVFVELWQLAWRLEEREMKLRTWLILRARRLCKNLLAHAPEIALQAEALPIGLQVWRPRAAASDPVSAQRHIVGRAVRRQSPSHRRALARAFLAPHHLKMGSSTPEAHTRRRTGWRRCQVALHRALRAIEHP